MTLEQKLDEENQDTNSTFYVFPKGIPGFEQLREFQLQEHNELFSLFSAVEQPATIFITVNPFDFFKDYEFELSDDALEDIGITSQEQIAVRCICTWNSDQSKTTVNLLAPLIFNIEQQTGKQIVLQNTKYTIKHPLWNEIEFSKGGES
ncbi:MULTISPECIES: flagellar assembly protein FliW [Paenibacillus]|uniref:Flagellar assembly factor FliW n=1 Tax=Paenibacillus polymyxa TaxID=1406 RepID=A0AAP4A675_PAEPO|nr:flagellar assembly protein FliW [Paenibacillus polymyxa]MDH2333494.1 flagellar assembly protein FliW [Paenibacillus polymyxa]